MNADVRKSPRGLINRNPGNLRYIEDPKHAWNGQCGNDRGLAVYESLTLGIRAACKQLLKGFQRSAETHDAAGENTVREIIERWAPPNENDTEAYVASVCNMTGFAPNAALLPDAFTLFTLLRAIFRVELGGYFVSDDTIRAGVDMALSGR